MKKVSQLRLAIKDILKNSDELSTLDTALARLDDMPIRELAKKLNTLPAPMLALDKVANDLRNQIGNTSKFNNLLEKTVKPAAFKKAMVIELYGKVFEGRRQLRSSLTKKQMIEMFKTQQRREVNYRAA